ncbi:hypothetical protein LH51_03660 [Nitrincola sp. A-D6]|uniref:hypothetical protein n=1 Tax=Nitrincola sp. A-D6 TaxID=1545442 RepID=UPI00051F9297|nr:hypothetical protein [Nitrincola sp. A-D6]KGK42908.1 hypothetical protein LH51_03660 [Nitrincola sp. A-D6]
MIEIQEYVGWPIRRLILPNEEQVICLYCKTGNEPELNLYDANHNVFRLDKDGNVVWQITRIDDPVVNWKYLHQLAREEGRRGWIDPFTQFRVYREDGSVIIERHPPTEKPDWRGYYRYFGVDEYGKLRNLVTKKPPPYTEALPDVVAWQPGYRVELFALGIGSLLFELDVETGVATEITPKGQRPW